MGIGTDDEIARAFEGMEVDQKIDASGCCILPGKLGLGSGIIDNAWFRFC